MARLPKRKKYNKYAHASLPDAVFDYHGRGILSPSGICSLAEEFLRECSRKGYSKVLVITGRGLHSSNGPVVGPLLRDFLPTLAVVESVVSTRVDRGGEGALEVRLCV